MSYEVLARKWRPQRFRDVVGQEHITKTLQNAIVRDRIGHAYLFVGPRGTGKTTSARIFAKALNCENPETDEAGHIEPCCACPTCDEIAHGSCLDVLEIDGASNNKVDDIRDLRETVQYSPTNGRKYKVYIIDEVHMLTAGAWNALLKTLEEPPSHVKFLFATTEAHKVLATILSRCQRFDLKPIAASIICARLRQIADAEGIFIDDEALAVIARAADGGMRDAQSIFDQMIAFCAGDSEATKIGEADVVEVFGLASQTELRRLAEAMVQNDAQGAVLALAHLADKGRNLERLYQDLLLTLRAVMIEQIVSEPNTILGLSESDEAEIRELAQRLSPRVVRRLVEALMSFDGRLRNTLNKRVFLETVLLRVMREAHAVSIDDLLTRLRAAQQGGAMAPLEVVAPATLPVEKKKLDAKPRERLTTPPPVAVIQAPTAPVNQAGEPASSTPAPPMTAAAVPPPATPPAEPPPASVPPERPPAPAEPQAPAAATAAQPPPEASPAPPAPPPAPVPPPEVSPTSPPPPLPGPPAPGPRVPTPPSGAPASEPVAPPKPPPPASHAAPTAPTAPEDSSDSDVLSARSKVQTATTEEWKRIEKLPFVEQLTLGFEGRVVDVRRKED